jgi:hypothetical protein
MRHSQLREYVHYLDRAGKPAVRLTRPTLTGKGGGNAVTSGLASVTVRWRSDASPMNPRQARADGAIAVLAVGVPGDSDGVARIPSPLGTINTSPGSTLNWICERDGDERHYRIVEDDDARHSTWEAVEVSW